MVQTDTSTEAGLYTLFVTDRVKEEGKHGELVGSEQQHGHYFLETSIKGAIRHSVAHLRRLRANRKFWELGEVELVEAKLKLAGMEFKDVTSQVREAYT